MHSGEVDKIHRSETSNPDLEALVQNVERVLQARQSQTGIQFASIHRRWMRHQVSLEELQLWDASRSPIIDYLVTGETQRSLNWTPSIIPAHKPASLSSRAGDPADAVKTHLSHLSKCLPHRRCCNAAMV